jgi:hypothetical protein
VPFSDPTDRYQLFKMEREDFTRWEELPEGYSFIRKIPRRAERKLLQSEFPHWRIPYNREMPGMVEDSVVAVGHGKRQKLVALLYSSDAETGEPDYGQIHYTVVEPEHRGANLLAAMVTELFRRWPDYKGGYFHVDREGHEGMYARWGGEKKGERAKDGEGGPPSLARRARAKLGALRRKISGG